VHVGDPFAGELATAGLAHFRLYERPPGRSMYGYTYTHEDPVNLMAGCRQYHDACVMFNNPSMLADAKRLRVLMGAA
jgi:uncharacterized protein YecE (DUF72 family)